MAGSTVVSPRPEGGGASTERGRSESRRGFRRRPKSGGFGFSQRFAGGAVHNGPGPGAYDVKRDGVEGSKGYSFAIDTRDRQFNLELQQLGQSPGPVYNITPTKIASVGGIMSYKLPVMEKDEVPGPGQYSLSPEPPKRVPRFAFGDGKTKSRFLPITSDSPGPNYNISPERSPKGGFSMGSAARDAQWKVFTGASDSPGPVYNVVNANAKPSPRYSFGTRTFTRNVMEDTPGPKYNVEIPYSTRGGAVMRPSTVRKVAPPPPPSPPANQSPKNSPSPPHHRPTPTFARETRTAYYDRLAKQVASPGPAYDVTRATQKKGPAYTLRGKHDAKEVDIGPGAAAYDIRKTPGSEAKAFSFGKDTRDREFRQMIKNNSCSPGPRYNLSPVKYLNNFSPPTPRAWNAGSGMSMVPTPPLGYRPSPRRLQWMSPRNVEEEEDAGGLE